MGSEYDPLFPNRSGDGNDDLARARSLFAAAAEPFTRSPLSWLVWAVLLPTIALSNDTLWTGYGLRGVIFGWSGVILVGGVIEGWIVRRRAAAPRTTLAGWVLRSQANLSFVAVVLSAALAWAGRVALLPGVWLLVLGHSFLVLGALAFKPFRRAGWIYQLGGVAALWPGQDGLLWFAIATGAGNLVIALGVARRGSGD